jgi:hypothetical protein
MWKPRKAISRSGGYSFTKEKTIGKIYLFIKKTIKVTSYNATITHNKGSPYEASENRFFNINSCTSVDTS